MKRTAFEGYSVFSPNGYYQVLHIESEASDYLKQINQKIKDKLFMD
jgi:hypothetical protein